jgi:hypothetical protein
MDEGHTQGVDDDEASSATPPRGSNGRLEISRLKRGGDLFRAYHVLVDGNDIGEVRRGRSRLFWITPGRHEVHIVIDWARSPSIEVDVAPGETVKLICWPKFHFGQAKRAMANPHEWIVLERSADVDGRAVGQ